MVGGEGARSDGPDSSPSPEADAPVPPAQHGVRSVGRHALFTAVGNAAGLGLGLAVSLISARVLGPEGQGLLAALRTDGTIVAAILGLGMPGALWYYASRSPRDRPALMGLSLIQAALLAGITLLAVSAFGAEIARRQGAAGREELYMLGVALVPALYLEYVTVNLLRAHQRFQLANVVSVLGRLAGLLATLWLVVAWELGVAGAVVAAIAVSAAQIVIGYPVLLRRGVALSRRVARECLSYGLRAQVGLLFRVASLRFDVLLLSFLAPLSVVGYYTVAQVVTETALMISLAFGYILGPIVAEGGRREELARRILRLNGTLTLLYVLALVAVGPLLVTVAFGDAYRPAVLPLLILLPGVWLFACGDLVSWVLSARGRPGAASWLAVYQGAATLVLDVILIPLFGVVGAAVGASIANVTYGVISLVVLAREDRVSAASLLIVTRSELRIYLSEARRRLRRGGGTPGPNRP